MSALKQLKNIVWGENFFTGNLYLALLAAGTLVAWKTQNFAVALAVYGVAVLLMAFFAKSLIGVYPVLAFASLSYGNVLTIDLESNLSLIVTGSIFIAAIIVAAVVFVIKNKISFKPRLQIWGFLAVIIAAALGGVGIKYFMTDTLLWLGGIGAAAGLLAAVWLLSCTVRDYNPKFTAKVFIVMALIVVIETMLYFAEMEDLEMKLAILNKTLTYGWGVSNAGGVVVLMGIPACFLYMTYQEERPFIPMMLVAVFVVTILFIQSRAAQLSALAILVPCLGFGFAFSKKKIQFLESGLIALVFLAVAYIAFREQLAELITRWKEMGLDNNGRTALWDATLEEIKSGHQAFGFGFMHLIPGTEMIMAHNQFLQFWVDFGLVGLCASVFYYFFIYKTLAFKTGKFGVFMVLTILVSDMFGFIDVVLFTPYCMMPLAIALSMSVNARAARANRPLIKALPAVGEVSLDAGATEIQCKEKIIAPIEDVIEGEEIPKIKKY